MATSIDSQQRALITKHATIKSQFTRFKTFLENQSQNPNLRQLELRITAMQELYTRFDDVQGQLEILDSVDEQIEERARFEEDYYEVISKAIDILKEGQATETSDSPTAQSIDNQISHQNVGITDIDVCLPKINLPTFNGIYEDWPGFYDQFKSIVNDNVRINDCKKLMYLRSCLTGEAAKIIQSLGNSSANYSVAWSILRKRYDDPAIVVSNHTRALFDMQPPRKASHRDLRQFLSATEAHYRALRALEQPTADTLLVYLITSKLDADTVLKWKENTRSSKFPRVEELLEFLHDRCKILEPLSSMDLSSNPRNAPNSYNSLGNAGSHAHFSQRRAPPQGDANHTRHTFTSQVNVHCGLCKGPHFTRACEKLLKAPVQERSEMIQRAKLCFNCLRSGHTSNECNSMNCTKCQRRHHTVLHMDATNPQPTQSSTVSLQVTTPSQVLLSTAIVNFVDCRGMNQPCRVLLDSCSQTHFLTEAMADKLGLRKSKINIPVTGINQVTSNVTHTVSATINSRSGDFSRSLDFLLLPKIAEKLPSHRLDKRSLNIPHNITLADPEFHKPGEIDALLGAGIFLKLFTVGQIELEGHLDTILQKTRLGWIISGEIHNDFKGYRAVVCNLATESLQSQISKFWTIEEGPQERFLSTEELACEAHYQRHTKRDADTGRYIVKLPFKETHRELGNSYTVALKRFQSLERSLNKNPESRSQYITFMREYQELGHMSVAKEALTQEGYYLPHHAVTKQSSVTTKVRVVFDGSAHTSLGTSLNETLMVGPTIQDDIFSLIVRFRSHVYVLTADIAKMYRQITVAPEDRKYQKILWREDSRQPLVTYELNTVTYGTSAASFLAIRSLQQLADDERRIYPRVSEILKRDFYVDDLLTGASTYDEAVSIRDELVQITNKAGFYLRQWASNEPRITETLHGCANNIHLRLDSSNVTKTLGVSWNPTQDMLYYTVHKDDSSLRITKRTILSQIAQLFDPLGLLGPVIVKAKLIMQRLWQLKTDWDESLPQDIHTAWRNYREELSQLHITIPRKIISDDPVDIQMHGFCDASEQAYGACIYLRSTDIHGNISTSLVCSKSRVAPLKSVSLPRLELCAAVLLCKLFKATSQSLNNIALNNVYFWSDSTITLHWIHTPPHSLKTFVANRVAEIQAITSPRNWGHIFSQDNPADIILRGQMPHEFAGNVHWFQGPSWLAHSEESWPKFELHLKQLPEQRPIVSLLTVTEDLDFLNKFSTLITLKRIVAYCLRFFHNVKNSEDRRTGHLTAKELQDAMTLIIKRVQREAFPNEIRALSQGKGLDKKSKLSPLNPFLDENGVIRVGGRLVRSDVPYSYKHQVLLPHNHHVTTLIIRNEHIKNYHSAAQATLHAVRQSYWPINGRKHVKSVLHRCITCRRANPLTPAYVMGQLPKDRVTINRPFLNAGVDFCGPIYIKEKKHRNRGKVKVYVAIFVCFTTKAVHIELVGDLTAEAFIATLKRFFARRGKCANLYSDNATNFTGARRALDEIRELLKASDERIHKHLANEHINWHFIPPRSPHFCGLWEASVKSFKNHMHRVIGDRLLSFEELLTYITEIEAILNSRPLVPLSSDPNDLTALTPGHFLIGDSLTSIAEHDLTAVPTPRLSSWKLVQQMKQHFWKRRYKEYLHELTVRKKWHSGATDDITIGSLVTIKEDHLPPLRWLLGRVIAVHPGADGVIRVVTVKTASGEYKRSIKKLSPLPITSEVNINNSDN